MAEALDLGVGHALGADRSDILMARGGAFADWIERTLGLRPKELASFEQAVTHSSRGKGHYERLEFLGDRVLGLVMAQWLVETNPDEAEGKLSHRLNALVTGEVCAEIGRELGVPDHLRLGKQARDDGVAQSDNVVGDVVEALIGALYLDAGLEAAAAFIRQTWRDRVNGLSAPPKHPKAELQEWMAANKRGFPIYTVVETSGPDHAPCFTVEVRIKGKGEAVGRGTTKQEAETAAATAMLEKLR